MSDQPKYIPLEQRAAWLIEKGRSAWQEVQRLAMAEDELIDSIVLLGQDLWLPHHETEGHKFSTTLRIGLHLPEQNQEAADAALESRFREIEEHFQDERGYVRIAAEVR